MKTGWIKYAGEAAAVVHCALSGLTSEWQKAAGKPSTALLRSDHSRQPLRPIKNGHDVIRREAACALSFGIGKPFWKNIAVTRSREHFKINGGADRRARRQRIDHQNRADSRECRRALAENFGSLGTYSLYIILLESKFNQRRMLFERISLLLIAAEGPAQAEDTRAPRTSTSV